MGRVLSSTAPGKLLIDTRNNNGPSIELYGTPYIILVHFEVVVMFRYELMIWTL
jgi:hypothetical protein